MTRAEQAMLLLLTHAYGVDRCSIIIPGVEDLEDPIAVVRVQPGTPFATVLFADASRYYMGLSPGLNENWGGFFQFIGFEANSPYLITPTPDPDPLKQPTAYAAIREMQVLGWTVVLSGAPTSDLEQELRPNRGTFWVRFISGDWYPNDRERPLHEMGRELRADLRRREATGFYTLIDGDAAEALDKGDRVFCGLPCELVRAPKDNPDGLCVYWVSLAES